MPFYKNWGFALLVVWVATFFANWAGSGGDPITLIVAELTATLGWFILYVRYGRRGKANSGNATPVHLWIVAGLSALWSAMRAYNYVMLDHQGAYYDGLFPALIEGARACGVWGALAGSLLLPVHSRYALIAFAISLAGMLIAWVYRYGVSPVPQIEYYVGLDVIEGAIALSLILYTWRRDARGTAR